MAWQEQHKQQSRDRILEAAAAMFARLGYSQVGISDVMLEAGLTRGAFYAHFASKADLYTQALAFAGEQVAKSFALPSHSLENFVKAYLHEDNLTERGMACPLACLVTDVAHCDEPVKQSYTQIFKCLLTQLRKLSSHKNTDEILADAVMMIGAVAIARTLTDIALGQQILRACQQRLLGELEVH